MKRIISLVLVIVLLSASVSFVSFASNDPQIHSVGEQSYSYDGLRESSPEFYESSSNDEISENTLNDRLSNLPASVDLTTSPYFPPVYGDQGLTNSCTSFAIAYYQFTYEVNKHRAVSTTQANTFCPQFMYSITQLVDDRGSAFDTSYKVLEDLGCLTYSDYYNWSTDATSASSALNYNDYISYCIDNTDAKINALNTRAIMTEKYVHAYEYDLNGQKQRIDTVIDFGPTATRADALDEVKSALASGKILTAGVRTSNCFADSNDGTKRVLKYSTTSGGSHAMAVVGYDDNVEVDANGDGHIDDWERGALKLADSYGLNHDNNHDGGCIWVMYDALNKVSACPDSTYNESTRTYFVQVMNFEERFYSIDVVDKDVYYIGKVNISTDKLRSIKTSYYTDNNTPIEYPNEILSLAFFPAYTSYYFNGDIIFDFSSFCTPFEYNYTGFDINMEFNSDYSNGTINSVSVIDNLNQTVVQVCNTPFTVPSTALQLSSTVSVTKGDLNYDGSINSSDKALMNQYLTSTIVFSNVQAFLADLNNDGVISIIDYIMLKALINGQSLSSLNEEDLLVLYSNGLFD